jgi:hypothetical protein
MLLNQPAPAMITKIIRMRNRMFKVFWETGTPASMRMSNTIANTNRKMEMMLIIVGFLIYASKGGPKKKPEGVLSSGCLINFLFCI